VRSGPAPNVTAETLAVMPGVLVALGVGDEEGVGDSVAVGEGVAPGPGVWVGPGSNALGP